MWCENVIGERCFGFSFVKMSQKWGGTPLLKVAFWLDRAVLLHLQLHGWWSPFKGIVMHKVMWGNTFFKMEICHKIYKAACRRRKLFGYKHQSLSTRHQSLSYSRHCAKVRGGPRLRGCVPVHGLSRVTAIGLFDFKQCILYVQMHLLALCFHWGFFLFSNASDNSELKQSPLVKTPLEMRNERKRGLLKQHNAPDCLGRPCIKMRSFRNFPLKCFQFLNCLLFGKWIASWLKKKRDN